MQSKANNSQDLGKNNDSAEAAKLKPVADEKVEQPVGETPAVETTLGNVLEAVEELWPKSLAEGWDAVGLVTGRTSQKISKIVMAVDPTLEVIEDAIKRGADLLITHHPLLLRGVTQVAGTSFKGEAIHRLIESGTALLTAHTNADSAIGESTTRWPMLSDSRAACRWSNLRTDFRKKAWAVSGSWRSR